MKKTNSDGTAWETHLVNTELKKSGGLFRADGEDLFALDFDFDAEGGTDVAALNNGAAHPDVAGQIGGLEGIVERTAARIADKGMIGALVAIVIPEPLQVRDIFELAGAVRSLS